MLLLMETLSNSLAHASDGDTGGRGEDGGSSRDSDGWLSTYCVSRYGVVGKTASSSLSGYKFWFCHLLATDIGLVIYTLVTQFPTYIMGMIIVPAS